MSIEHGYMNRMCHLQLQVCKWTVNGIIIMTQLKMLASRGSHELLQPNLQYSCHIVHRHATQFVSGEV
jgi:hypothetical protein